MTIQQQILTIFIAILAVQLCRWIAFWLFPADKPIPPFIKYLGQVLPPAVFAMLVVYCYKNADIFSQYHAVPELMAGAVVVILHIWQRNMFLSIAVGTILYMYLVQKVFI